MNKNLKYTTTFLFVIATFIASLVFFQYAQAAAPAAVQLWTDHADRQYVESSRAQVYLKVNQKPASPDFRNSIEATYVLPTQSFRVIFQPRGDGYVYTTPRLPLGTVHLYVNVFMENGKEMDALRRSLKETQTQIVEIDRLLAQHPTPELEAEHARLITLRVELEHRIQTNRQQIYSEDVTLTAVSASRPTAKLKLSSTSSETVPVTALFDASESSDPAGLPLTYTYSFGERDGDLIQGAYGTHTFEHAGTFTVTVTVTNTAGASDSKSIQITTIAPVLPPPAEEIAPPLPPETPVPVQDQVKFIYEGENAPQKGVEPEAIEPERASGFRGLVKDGDGNPLAAVKVTIAGEPQFGSTLTREDGSFDLVANVGNTVTLNFEKSGYGPVQKAVSTSDQGYYSVEAPMMVKQDEKVTAVSLGGTEHQPVVATPVSDSNGTRTASLIMPPGLSAQVQMPDGSLKTVPNLNVRITEVTVGENGQKKMPAVLPPRTAYTYAVELTSDEATAMGGKGVQFNQEIPFYVDNFLNLPVGTAVPLGYYDPQTKSWKAEKDGIIASIDEIVNGKAVLSFAPGKRATRAQLDYFHVTDGELYKLARIYRAGTTVSRITTKHFSYVDLNYMSGGEAQQVAAAGPISNEEPCDRCIRDGSAIEVNRRSFKESVPLAGVSFDLTYSSNTSLGYKAKGQLLVPLSDSAYPNNLLGIHVTSSVAGNIIERDYEPATNLIFDYTWDGKDSFGRFMTSQVNAEIKIQYRYKDQYGYKPYDPDSTTSFDTSLANVSLTPGRGEIFLEKSISVPLEPPSDAATSSALKNLGGWVIPIQHRLDVLTQKLYLGNGGEIAVKNRPRSVRTVIGGSTGFVDNVPAAQAKYKNLSGYSFSPDGTILILDRGNYRIRRIGKDGIVRTIAGTGTPTFNGDGIPAVEAQINPQSGVYQTRSGVVVFADTGNNRIRRITTSGIIQTIAGNGTAGYSGDGGPAINAQLNAPRSVHGSSDGSIYFSDSSNNVIRRITPQGTIETLAGTGTAGYSGDGGPGKFAMLNNPRVSALDSEGNILIADIDNHRIRRLATNGTITTVVGTGVAGYSGDDGPALEAQLNKPTAVNLRPDGSMYIADSENRRIRLVDTKGIISTFMGTGLEAGYNGDGKTAEEVNLQSPTVAIVRNDGSVYVVAGGNRILKYSYPLYVDSGSGYSVPSEDGNEIYYFSSAGVHQKTVSGLTGAIIYKFNYDSNGLLSSVEDGYGKMTIFERSGGVITAVQSPYGQTTHLTYNSDGLLESVQSPLGSTYTMTYNAAGLMSTFMKPEGNTTSFEYDAQGYLVKETSAAGGIQTLVRNLGQVIHTSAMGYITKVEDTKTERGTSSATTLPNGSIIRSTGGTTTYRETYNSSVGTYNTKSLYNDLRFDGASIYASYEVESSAALYNRFQKKVSYPVLTGIFDFVREIATIGPNHETLLNRFSTQDRSSISTTGMGRTTTAVLDAHEALSSYQVGNFSPKQYFYDGDGRLIQVMQGNRTTQMSYNSQGYLAQVTDPMNQVTQMTYDADGNLVSQTTNDGRTHNFRYDLNSNLTGVMPASRGWHDLAYTVLDLFHLYKPPVVNGSSFETGITYNLDKQPVQRVRADGRNVVYNYNTTTGDLNSVQSVDTNATYTYNLGRLVSISTSESSIQFQWIGNVLSKKIYSGAFSLPQQNHYQTGTYRVTAVGMDGQGVALGYDADGNVVQVGDMTITRDTLTPLVTGTSLGSLNQGVTYDNFGAVSSRTYSFGGSSVYAENYTRDKINRITQKTVTTSSGSKTYGYTYNSAGRLSEVRVDGALVSQYTYDAQGNRTQATVGGNSYSGIYDEQDRLASYGGYNYFFNDDGELTSKLHTSPPETTGYTYTTLGQLSSVHLPGGREISYLIDGENHRIARKVDGIVQSYYAYDMSGRLVAELDSAGALKSRFVYATQSHSPDYMITASGTYGFIKDQLGSIKVVMNVATGAIAQAIEYDEFGRVLSDSTPGFQPFGYAGGIYDAETKLVRFGARDYDAETGRWTAKDPILFAGGSVNLYSYVHNDPINSIDPSGFTEEELRAAIEWVRSNHPELFSTVDPQFVDARLADMGFTVDSTLIKINIRGIDELYNNYDDRMEQYVATVAHELQHAADMRACNDSDSYKTMMNLLPNRHTSVIEKRAVEIGQEYRRAIRYQRAGAMR